MHTFPPTIILRHRKENLKKCSLKGLESRPDLSFYTYPWKAPQPSLSDYIVLSLDGPPLSYKDKDKGIFLIDGTWRHAQKMFSSLSHPFETRTIPSGFKTVYPRCQNDCIDPERGLASVEALYLAYLTLGRRIDGLLDHYHWKEQFLSHARAELAADMTFPLANKLQ